MRELHRVVIREVCGDQNNVMGEAVMTTRERNSLSKAIAKHCKRAAERRNVEASTLKAKLAELGADADEVPF